MWDYTDKVKDLFLNPKNVGEIEDADAVGEVGSITCGDALRLSLKIDEDGRIADAKFKTFGCASAIASSSVLTELVKGKTLEEAAKISNREIANALGGLPEEKMHCSVMGMEALEAAIANYKGEKPPSEGMDEGDLICKCFGVTDTRIRRVVRENNLSTVEQVTNYTKAGGACTSCIMDIEDIVNEEIAAREAAASTPGLEAPSSKKLTNLQRISMIQGVIEDEVKPQLRKDGGDIELVDIDGNDVIVSLRGMCMGCQSAPITIAYVQERLREFVTPELNVVIDQG
jgi:NifU-like protein